MTKSSVEKQISELKGDVAGIKLVLEVICKKMAIKIPEAPDETLLSLGEAAQLLNVPAEFIIAKCTGGQIPFQKRRTIIKIRRLDLIGFMRSVSEGEEGSVDHYVNRYLEQRPLKG